MFLGGGNISNWPLRTLELKREKLYNQSMRRLHLQHHKVKIRETEVFGKNGKGILTQLNGLTIDFYYM